METCSRQKDLQLLASVSEQPSTLLNHWRQPVKVRHAITSMAPKSSDCCKSPHVPKKLDSDVSTRKTPLCLQACTLSYQKKDSAGSAILNRHFTRGMALLSGAYGAEVCAPQGSHRSGVPAWPDHWATSESGPHAWSHRQTPLSAPATQPNGISTAHASENMAMQNSMHVAKSSMMQSL